MHWDSGGWCEAQCQNTSNVVRFRQETLTKFMILHLIQFGVEWGQNRRLVFFMLFMSCYGPIRIYISVWDHVRIGLGLSNRVRFESPIYKGHDKCHVSWTRIWDWELSSGSSQDGSPHILVLMVLYYWSFDLLLVSCVGLNFFIQTWVFV